MRESGAPNWHFATQHCQDWKDWPDRLVNSKKPDVDCFYDEYQYGTVGFPIFNESRGCPTAAQGVPGQPQGSQRTANGNPRAPQGEPKEAQRKAKGAQSQAKGGQRRQKTTQGTNYINKLPINCPSGCYV